VSRLEETATDLYALAPGDFTAERNRRAKEVRAAGDAALAERIQKLRKPTTAAWLLNTLVRHHRDEVDRVLSLGAELRAAQGVLSGDELRALDRTRRQLTHAVTEQARALGLEAGHPVSQQVATLVEESLRTAMADAGAAAALSTGLLTDSFSSTGLDPVAVDGVVAVPEAVPDGGAAPAAPRADRRRTSIPKRGPDPAEEAAARAELDDATTALEEARRVAAQGEEASSAAQRDREALEGRRRELEQQLSDVQDALIDAKENERTARRLVETSTREERAAATAAQQAQDRLDRLR
jgi:hypothetical protein